MNVIQIAGRLGADPETRFTASGQKVTTMRLASNVRKAGNDDTMWWRVTIWGDRFDKMMQYFKKGSAVIVVGTMQKPDIFQGKDGDSRVSLDVTAEMVMFSPFGRSDRSGSDGAEAGEGFQKGSPAAGMNFSSTPTTGNGQEPISGTSGVGNTNDDLPF